MAEKESLKRELEKKVENLNYLLRSEIRNGEEFEKKNQQKLDRLKTQIETTEGSEKIRLIQELKDQKRSKDELLEKQAGLEKEVRDIKQQLMEEEKMAHRLEEETKRKEEEKKKLDQIHKNKMRELRKKLLDSVLEQEVTHRKINEQMETIGKLEVENQGKQRSIIEKKRD